MNLVTVRKSEDGLTVRTSKNPLYGFVVMEQKGAFAVSATGWVDIKTPTCLIQGTMENLKAMEETLNKGLVGKIVHKESLEPFNLKNPMNDIKYAGKTKIACSVKGKPIYRVSTFSADINAVDELIAHDNGKQISEANLKGQAVQSLSALKAEPVTA